MSGVCAPERRGRIPIGSGKKKSPESTLREGIRPPRVSDPRALSLIVYQKFHRELPHMEEEPADRDLRRIILEAINLLPDFEAAPGKRDNLIHIRSTLDADTEKIPEDELNIQYTIDALRTLWRDYHEYVEKYI